MPTYEYECSHCDHSFELFQSMSDAVKKKCPECKKMKLLRLIGGGGAVLFKGSGFYTTDYRSKSYEAGKKADTPSSDSCGGKPSSCSKPDCGSKD